MYPLSHPLLHLPYTSVTLAKNMGRNYEGNISVEELLEMSQDEMEKVAND